MKRVVREAIDAGALGFTTSRTEKHRDVRGEVTPSITAHEDELIGIAKALGEAGKGVLQGISDFYEFDSEFRMFRAMAEAWHPPLVQSERKSLKTTAAEGSVPGSHDHDESPGGPTADMERTRELEKAVEDLELEEVASFLSANRDADGNAGGSDPGEAVPPHSYLA